jgi:hypothetical protein
MTRQHDQLSMESHYRHIIDTFDLHHLDSVAELSVTPSVVKPLIRTLDTSRPDKYKRRRKESHEAKDK